jgi:hypothetical protein
VVILALELLFQIAVLEKGLEINHMAGDDG